jgi:hypothetical protein
MTRASITGECTAPGQKGAHGFVQRVPFYYGWVNVGIAAVAMVATLPARTHGLGLITEQLLRDLRLDRECMR